MLLFWKLVDETQMVKPPEPTSHHNSKKYLILLPLRAIYFRSLYYETPCICLYVAREFFQLYQYVQTSGLEYSMKNFEYSSARSEVSRWMIGLAGTMSMSSKLDSSSCWARVWGKKWKYWVRLDHIGSNWIELDQNRSKWFKIDWIRSNWIKMDKKGSKRIKMDQNGSKMDQKG